MEYKKVIPFEDQWDIGNISAVIDRIQASPIGQLPNVLREVLQEQMIETLSVVHEGLTLHGLPLGNDGNVGLIIEHRASHGRSVPDELVNIDLSRFIVAEAHELCSPEFPYQYHEVLDTWIDYLQETVVTLKNAKTLVTMIPKSENCKGQ